MIALLSSASPQDRPVLLQDRESALEIGYFVIHFSVSCFYSKPKPRQLRGLGAQALIARYVGHF